MNQTTTLMYIQYCKEIQHSHNMEDLAEMKLNLETLLTMVNDQMEMMMD